MKHYIGLLIALGILYFFVALCNWIIDIRTDNRIDRKLRREEKANKHE